LIVRSPALSLPSGALVAVALLAAGCGAEPATDVDTPPASRFATGVATVPASAPASAGGGVGTAGIGTASPSAGVKAATGGANTFTPYTSGATAITYDTAVVPTGATATITTAKAGPGVKVRLVVTGLKPRRAYGAHLHTDPCAGKPDLAGPHYQHLPDPKAVTSPPSVDPRFANPRNEVWLDFTTDATGAASATAIQAWPFDEISPPRSLVLHARQTQTAKGRAGMAGPRVACLTLPL
jgi:Cu-Zn family superoxide dismutase